MCGGILFCVLFVFLLFGLLMAILPLMGVNIELLHLVYCGIGVLIFSIYLIYDTQVRSFLCFCVYVQICTDDSSYLKKKCFGPLLYSNDPIPTQNMRF